MSTELERALFAEQEDLAMRAILTTYKKSTEKGVKQWLDRWYDSKRHLIESFGGLYLEGFCADMNLEDEEPEEIGVRNYFEINAAQLWREVSEMFDGRGHTGAMDVLPFVLFEQDKIRNERGINNFIATKTEELNLPTIFPLPGMVKYMHRLLLSSADAAGNWMHFQCKGLDIIKPAYQDRVIDYDRYTNWVDYSVMEDRFYGANIADILEKIIEVTPVETVLENKTNTGMKITKFLKKLYPEDWIIFQYPQEDGRVLGYWENFEKHWSMKLQTLKDRTKRDSIKAEKPDVIVSLDPIDYLMMSEASSWRSCHQFHGNLYATGGPAYAVDPCTAIAYAPRGKMEKYNVEFYDKSWRQVVHIDLEKGAAVFGREYPKDASRLARATRGAVNYMLADQHGASRKWWMTRRVGKANLAVAGKYIYAESAGAGVMTKLKDINEAVNIGYGTNILECMSCGSMTLEPNDRGRRSLICGVCQVGQLRVLEGIDQSLYLNTLYVGEEHTLPRRSGVDPNTARYSCSCCGSARRAYNLYGVLCGGAWDIVGGGVRVCKECLDERPAAVNALGVYACHRCRILCTAEGGIINSYEDLPGDVYCQECAIREQHARGNRRCNCCSNYYREDALRSLSGGVYVCEHCATDNIVVCEDCNEEIYEGFSCNLPDGRSVCDDCWSEYPSCDSCELCTYESDLILVEEFDRMVCNECYDELFGLCERCNELGYNSDFMGIEDLEAELDVLVCESCHDEIQDNNYRIEQEGESV